MVFSSYFFVFLFLPVFLTVYREVPERLKNVLLLAASVVFYYLGDHSGTLVLFASVLGNYAFGYAIGHRRAMRGTEGRNRTDVWLVGGIAFNLALLAYFKYAGFLGHAVDQVGAHFGHPQLIPIISVALPLGISFFAFQGISYLVDVHRGTILATSSLLRFATYKTLFPQLIAGPIVRYSDVAEQLRHRHVDDDQLLEGTRRFVIGFCKKVLVADTIAVTADAIFALPGGQLDFGTAWLGVIAYAIQIYFDFSAYSDMAIGLGLMMGFRFPENFNYPYVSKSVREFWRRWHMTLSSWFRDYLYVPLGGNRKGGIRTYANLVVVFLLTGLWHGAAWTFVAWGLWYGLFMVFERAVDFDRRSIPTAVRRSYLLLVVLFGWVLFRADSFSHAVAIATAMLGFSVSDGSHPVGEYLNVLQTAALVAGIVFSMPTCGWLARGLSPRARKISGVITLTVLFVFAGCKVLSGAYSPFLYFRF